MGVSDEGEDPDVGVGQRPQDGGGLQGQREGKNCGEEAELEVDEGQDS